MQIPGRDDVSDELIHFTKGNDDASAFEVLRAILHDGRLRGGTGMIRGEYQCVCFTEAPLDKIGPSIVHANRQGRRYRPFGVIVEKAWLYARGGRPVIYGPDSQFDELAPGQRWRHVRYEPDVEQQVDFTWEREWRIATNELAVTPASCRVLVLNSVWADRLVREHEDAQSRLVDQWRFAVDEYLAEMVREPFPWELDLLE